MKYNSVSSFLVRHLTVIRVTLVAFIFLSFAKSLLDFSHKINDSPQALSTVPNAFAPTLPDVNNIAQLGWFGVAQDPQTASAVASLTAGQFDLKGVSKSGQTKLVGAFIAEKGKPENYYHAGDALPGGAGTLEEIFDDHVTIRNGQSIAILKFAPVDPAAAR